MGVTAQLGCDYVSPKRQIHCNRVLHMNVEVDMVLEPQMYDVGWEMVDGECRCPEHAQE